VNDLEGEPMLRQLPLDLWDDTDRAALWEGFAPLDRDRVVDLYTRLALRAARDAGPAHGSVEPQPEDGHDGRTADERNAR
jgi:hypothetical protein